MPAPRGSVPATAAAAISGVRKVYTGHVHQPDRFTRDGIDVVVTGSMVPLARGEDPTGEW